MLVATSVEDIKLLGTPMSSMHAKLWTQLRTPTAQGINNNGQCGCYEFLKLAPSVLLGTMLH